MCMYGTCQNVNKYKQSEQVQMLGQTCFRWMLSHWRNMFQMDVYTLDKHVVNGCIQVCGRCSFRCQRLKMLGQTCFGRMDANKYKFVENAWTLKSRCLDIQVEDAWTNTSQMTTHTIYSCLDKHVYVWDLSKC